MQRTGDLLTPDEKGRLAQNFAGYDISPDMVRLSLVNMYLHGFTDPHIYEYDTLTSQDRWNEYADVILANPPFMSPKGGIKPHNRFSVQSKRSEVLFVDYMAEHLTPSGRAGIIVPEGIIFQSQTAYTQLRRMLVEDYLVAVVSLPAGVFNPYSGVKTSILILDKPLAKQVSTIGFFKIENDGFGLGAQRRPIDKDDLPQARAEIAEYLRRLRARESMEDFKLTRGLIVPKEKIAANGDFNLSGERYREGTARQGAFPYVRLDEIAEIAAGNSAPQGEEYFKEGQYPFIRTSDVGAVHLSDNFVGTADKVNQKAIEELRLRSFPVGTILFPKSGASTFLNHRVVMGEAGYVSSHLACIVCDNAKALPKYVYALLCQVDARQITPDQAYPSLRLTEIESIEIPLPPLDVQKEIVAEIEGYQKVIDGARAVLDNYRPHISIHPDWPMVELQDVADLINGDRGTNYPSAKHRVAAGIPFVNAGHISDGDISLDGMDYITPERYDLLGSGKFNRGDILYCLRGSLGKCALVQSIELGAIASSLLIIRPKGDVLTRYLYTFLTGKDGQRLISENNTGSAQPNLSASNVRKYAIPLPPLNTQRAIVAEIEAEQALVNANRELIERMEKKIHAVLARVWGE